MSEMTAVERTSRMLKRQKADRICAFEHYWPDTMRDWIEKGHIKEGESLAGHFGYDMDIAGGVNTVADLDFKPVTVAEDEDTITMKDGNGATLRRHKKHDTTPEHVAYDIREAAHYYERIQPMLKPDPRRTNIEWHTATREKCREENRFYNWSQIGVFECMHSLCGHENLLVGAALEPEWVAEMAMDYARLTTAMMEEAFAKGGVPDGVWSYEDLGFKERPFMSPAMYKELFLPALKHQVACAKSYGLPFILHSCGFVEPLIPFFIEAGIDALQVIEIKAGMDLLRIYKNYGDRLSLIGGIDVRTLYTNDCAIIDAEIEAKIPIVKQGFGYTLHSDHSIPNTVDYSTYRYFLDRGLELGKV